MLAAPSIRLTMCGAALLLSACSTPDSAGPSGLESPPPGVGAPPTAAKLSRAYTTVLDKHYATVRAQPGECSRAVHDRFWVYGLDGKVYPTWHPPVDPQTGCTFGHEHGRDPAGSVWGNRPIPFGFVSEQFEPTAPDRQRDEDHVGHKIEWANNAEAATPGGNPERIRCDILTKLHQGTHSADAMTNNMHELFFDIRCDNGMEVHWKALSRLGQPGRVDGSCAGAGTGQHAPGPASPPSSVGGKGTRALPDWDPCIRARVVEQRQHWAISERWIANYGVAAGESGVTEADRTGNLRLNGAVYMAVSDPPRFMRLEMPGKIGRMIEICQTPQLRALDVCRGSEAGTVPWDDPRSPFLGASRNTLLIDSFEIDNKTGITRWYTDPLGNRISSTPFPGGTMEQHISLATKREYFGTEVRANYAGRGVHAPN